ICTLALSIGFADASTLGRLLRRLLLRSIFSPPMRQAGESRVQAVTPHPAAANPRIHRLVFFDPLGKTIRHQIQLDVMLKECFEAREYQSEALSRAGHLFHKFVAIASEASFRDADKGRAILLGRKRPFHRGETTVSRPLDDNALVR